jgi:hypothetical protein
MASARQVAANRRNASLPRGPLSDEACAAIKEMPSSTDSPQST